MEQTLMNDFDAFECLANPAEPEPRAQFIVMCRVSGGVTGTREAPLKDAQGAVRYFSSWAEADHEAKSRASVARGPATDHMPRARFAYWAAEQGEL